MPDTFLEKISMTEMPQANSLRIESDIPPLSLF